MYIYIYAKRRRTYRVVKDDARTSRMQDREGKQRRMPNTTESVHMESAATHTKYLLTTYACLDSQVASTCCHIVADRLSKLTSWPSTSPPLLRLILSPMLWQKRSLTFSLILSLAQSLTFVLLAQVCYCHSLLLSLIMLISLEPSRAACKLT
jgi:hypothetical protein